MWRRSCRARRPPKSESWRRCENEIKRSFRARRPSKSESGRCENEAFVRDILQILRLKLCKTMPETAVTLQDRSEHDPPLTGRVPQPSRDRPSPSIFRDTFCPANYSMSCIHYLSKNSKAHFVRDVPQNLNIEDVKTKLSRETSFKIWTLKLLRHPFALTLGCCDIPLLCHPTALTSLCFDIPLLWHPHCFDIPLLSHPFALTSHCFDIPLLWHSFALTSLCCDIPLLIALLWHPFALTSRCFDIPLLWHPFALTSLCCDIPLLWHSIALTSPCCDVPLLWHSKDP